MITNKTMSLFSHIVDLDDLRKEGDKMIYTYGFVSNQRTIDNTYQNVAPVCEMSLDSMSFTKDIGYYSHTNYPGINLFITRSVQGEGINPPRKVMGAYAQELCIKIAKFIETQCFNGTLNSNYLTCRQAVNAEFGSAIRSLEINKMVPFNKAKNYMPERITFIIPATGSQQPEEERIYLWFSDRAFRTQYTHYTIDPVCMTDDVDLLLGDYDSVKKIIDTWTDNKYTEKMNEVKDKYPYTSANATIYKLYIKTGGVLNISLRSCIWGSIADNMDLIRDAWANYILDHSKYGRDIWEVAIPDLFVATEFIIVPYWQYYAIPNKELQKGIHSPSIPGKDLIPYITKSVPFYSSTYVSEYYTQSSNMYSSVACSIVGSEKNRLANKRFEQEWPEYFLVPTTSVEFNRISPATRKMMTVVHTLIKLADECLPDTELPLGVNKVLRNDILFLASTYLNVQYLVPLKWNYEKGVLSGSNSPTIPEYPSPEYDSEEAKRRREREEKEREAERKKQQELLAEAERIRKEEEARIAEIEAARKKREQEEKDRIEREKEAHKQASISRIKSEIEVIRTIINETNKMIGEAGDAYTDSRDTYTLYRQSSSSVELKNASNFIDNVLKYRYDTDGGLIALIKHNINTINKILESLYKDEFISEVKESVDALKPDIDHLTVDLAAIEVNRDRLVSMRDELKLLSENRAAIENASEESRKETVRKEQERLLNTVDSMSQEYTRISGKSEEIRTNLNSTNELVKTLETRLDSFYAEDVRNRIKNLYDYSTRALNNGINNSYINSIDYIEFFNHSPYLDETIPALLTAKNTINKTFEDIKNIYNSVMDAINKMNNSYISVSRLVYDRQDNEIDSHDTNAASKHKIIQLNKIIDDNYNKYVSKLKDRKYTTIYADAATKTAIAVNTLAMTDELEIEKARILLNDAKNYQALFLTELNKETETAETIRASFYEIANNVDINLVEQHYNEMKANLESERTSTANTSQIINYRNSVSSMIQRAENAINSAQSRLNEEKAQKEAEKELENKRLDKLEEKYLAQLTALRAKLNNVRDKQLTEATSQLDTAERIITDITSFNTATTIINQLSSYYTYANAANSMLSISDSVLSSSGLTTSFIRTSPIIDRLLTNVKSIEDLTESLKNTYQTLYAKYLDLNTKATAQYDRYLTILRNEQAANAKNDREYNRLVEIQNKLAGHIIESRLGDTIVKVLLEQITELNQIGVRVDAATTTSELRVEKSIYETKAATIRLNIIKLEDVINNHTSKYSEVSAEDAVKDIIVTYYDRLKTADTSFRTYVTNANQALTDSRIVYDKLVAKLNELGNEEKNELALGDQINTLVKRGMNLIGVINSNVTQFEVTTNNLRIRHDVTEDISSYTVDKLRDMLSSLDISESDYHGQYDLIIESENINNTQILSVINDANDEKYSKYRSIYENAFSEFNKYPETYTIALQLINGQKARGDNNIAAVRERLNRAISNKNLNELNVRLNINITDIKVYLDMVDIRIPDIRSKFATAQATLTTNKPQTLEILDSIDNIANATRISLTNSRDALGVAQTNITNAQRAIDEAVSENAIIDELKAKFVTVNGLKQDYETKLADFNQLIEDINQFKLTIA